MRWILIILLTVLSLTISGKDTKKISRLIAYPAYTEIFYVLKSDTSIRQGNYKLENMGKVLVEGHYQMGKQDSIWTQYNMQGIVRSKGWYENNKRNRIWEFFNDKGELEQRIDFTNNALLQYQTAFSNHLFQIHTNNDFFMSQLDRPPLYVGGSSRFCDYFANEVTIPLHKPNDKVVGTVYVTFKVDSLGITSNHRVLKGISKVCNEEAIRAIKAIPNDWMPGVLNGKFVTVDYIVTVIFDEKIRPVEF